MFKVIVLCCLLSLTAAINTKYLPPAISTTTNVIRDSQPQQTITRTTTQHQPVASVEYQKNFYIFTAPAEERKVYQQPSTTVFRKAQPVQQRKNVIIINAPATTNTIRRTHAQPIAPSTFTFGTTPARTTHTYSQRQQQNIVPIVSQTQQVLHQQPARKQQIVYQQQQQQPVVFKSSKPEVHFLKYRTKAEADQIQQRILQRFGFTEADINRSIAASGTQKAVATPVITLHGNSVQQKHNAGNVINLSSASAPVVSIDAKPISRDYQQTNVNSVYLPPSQNSITSTSITNNNNEANDKNYARNYLPPGKDVQLGSSYLPLV